MKMPTTQVGLGCQLLLTAVKGKPRFTPGASKTIQLGLSKLLSASTTVLVNSKTIKTIKLIEDTPKNTLCKSYSDADGKFNEGLAVLLTLLAGAKLPVLFSFSIAVEVAKQKKKQDGCIAPICKALG